MQKDAIIKYFLSISFNAPSFTNYDFLILHMNSQSNQPKLKRLLSQTSGLVFTPAGTFCSFGTDSKGSACPAWVDYVTSLAIQL